VKPKDTPRREARYEYPEEIGAATPGRGITDEVAERCLDYLRETAEPFAAWKARRIFLEKRLKTIQAIQADKSGATTESAKERAGLASAEFQACARELEEASFHEILLSAMRDAAEAKFEAWRTKNANERAGL
jgi:hypothetical protein